VQKTTKIQDILKTQNPKITFLASPAPQAQDALQKCIERYGQTSEPDADIIIALGGDGLMLQSLHRLMGSNVPIYGMNLGSVGFLMNEYSLDNLYERLAKAERSVIHPLIMRARSIDGALFEAYAINEVSLLRKSFQAAKLEITIDGRVRMAELTADGILLATPAGSTAYNLSANGPILPLNARLLALTPLSPFRPRRWRGALISERAKVLIKVLECDKRPVSAAADHLEVQSISQVEIEMDRSISLTMLHDPGHSLEERILTEQFGA
jgi:NAD+ kinase